MTVDGFDIWCEDRREEHVLGEENGGKYAKSRLKFHKFPLMNENIETSFLFHLFFRLGSRIYGFSRAFGESRLKYYKISDSKKNKKSKKIIILIFI